MTTRQFLLRAGNGIASGPIRLAVLTLCLTAGSLQPAQAQFKPVQPAQPTAPGAAGVQPQPSQPQLQAPPPAVQRPSDSGTAQRRVRTVDSIAAVVNNEVITQRELEDRYRLIESRMRKQGVAMPPREQLQKQLLERMIVDRVQLQLARDSGIRVDDTLLDRAMARMAEQNKMSLQEFRNQIESDGITYARFREEIRDEIVMQRLREREVDNRVQITESEIDNFMAESKGSAQQSELSIAHVLVRIPENASAEQIAQRRTRAEEALQQIRAGADFAKVAAAFSDANDALKGGELGWRTPDRLPQLFVDTVENTKPGEIAVVKSANGFHILKLVGRRNAAPASASAAASVQQTHVRHILIKVNQVVSSSEAKRRLTELRERLDNNAAKFEDLARLYSNDLSSTKGGDLGWILPGDTVPEFERAMNALQPGQISEPVESPFGWHLIQVTERKTEDVSKERQRFAARQALRERKIDEGAEEWLRQLRDRAYVEYRLEELAGNTR